MPAYEITHWNGGISPYEDRGILGAAKFLSGIDIHKKTDSLKCQQALIDEGTILQSISASQSPSASKSPSASVSPSISPSISPSASVSPSILTSPSSSKSPSSSRSPSASASPSGSLSPSSSVSPSPSPSAGLKTVFSGLILWFVPCSDGNTYGFDNTGKIYKRRSDASWIQVYDAGQRITGACEKPSATGKSYMLFATRTNLHLKELPGLSNWNDVDKTLGFPKTNLTDEDWHTMTQVGGDIFIANGSSLAFVGYDDSYTNDALDLIPGNVAKTLVERNGRSVIGTYRAADPNSGINSAIDSEVPLAQVGTDGELYYADFSSSIPVRRFPGGGRTNPGGAANKVSQVNFFDWEVNALSWINKQTVGNMALFGVWGGDTGKNGIYSFGRKDKDKPFVLNLEYAMNVDEIGAVTVVNGVILASYRSGTSFGVMAVDSNNKAQGIYEGLDFHSPIKSVITITPWKYVELFMAPLPDGANVQFWYKLNKTGNFIQAKTANGNSSFNTTNGKKAIFRVDAEGEVYEPRIVLNPYQNNSPEIYRARTYFG